MTDHQIILLGVWGVTGIMWATRNVRGGTCLIMTAIALAVSFY